MVPLLLLPLLWRGSLQQPHPGYKLRVQELVTVQEGLCVHVPCSFYPWSSWSSSTKVYTYWYRDGDNINRDAPVASSNPNKEVKTETQGRFLLSDPTANNCSLQIRDARWRDTGRYFLRVEKGGSEYNYGGRKLPGYSYTYKLLDLQVTDLTEKPHIRVWEPLESGRPTQLACSLPGACEGGQRFTFSWEGAAVDSLNPQNLSSSVLTFTPRPQDHDTNLTCQVKREGPKWTSQRTIRLNVSYPPQLLGPSCSWEDQGLHCSCSSRAQPAPSLRWRLGAGLLEGNHGNASHVVTSSSEGPWTNSSLRLREGLSPDLRLSCEAWNEHGAQSVSVLLLPGKAVPQAGAVPAALGGAGAMALLSLCVCLIFFCIVKARRRQAAGRPKVTNDEEPVMGTVTWGSKKNLQPDGPPNQAPSAEKGPLSGEQQELYYANLTFEGMKPRELQFQEATSTHEYSEVKHAGQ
ncbi:sialic acid-binding Ig-like lectin 5 isoform X1 [Myotis yumanensis]|uniref:sialic acid-binding Ig-like lectin 5 isoform X1 n=1 Tax=Myotis yumanensis TaxID=159337 RepID=UPI0038D3DAA3